MCPTQDFGIVKIAAELKRCFDPNEASADRTVRVHGSDRAKEKGLCRVHPEHEEEERGNY
jgi:hypothetical protein